MGATCSVNTHTNGHLVYAERSFDLKVVGASYGRGGSGATVTYVMSTSEIGLMLIASTTYGVCWLGIHQSGAYLESELRRDFPKADVVRDKAEVCRITRGMAAFISRTCPTLDVPLDIRASPFQVAVWRELCAIPLGETRSYGEIARRLGLPGGARAVGRANGSNPLAVLIPCHRAIGADGKLTGYRWGIEYKRRLLEYERSLVNLRSSHHQ